MAGKGRKRDGKGGKEGRGGKGEGREMDPHNFENRSTPMIGLQHCKTGKLSNRPRGPNT